jgi:hypothetical protein
LASATGSTVAGGYQNTASGFGAFVGGGGFDGTSVGGNKASGNASVVSGGWSNLASANYAVVSGGFADLAVANYCVVSGGLSNSASGAISFVGGGQSNTAGGFYSAVGGGQTNSAAGQNSVVGGGANNDAGGSTAVVGGGLRNSVVATGGGGTIGGGGLNTVSALYATVPGGYNNSASGLESFAAGYSAKAYDNNSFVWADGSLPNGFISQGPQTFNVLASGGVYFWNSLDPTVVISSSGYVGIGTSVPSKPLDILGSGITECTVHSVNERAIVSLHSVVSSQDQVWTLESGVSGTPGLFGIFDRTAFQQRMTIDTSGNAYFNGPNVSVCTLTIRGGCDLAEPFQISKRPEQDIPEGSVLVIDDQNPGQLKLSHRPYDTSVAGVVSGANGINPGIQMQQQGLLEGGRNVALTGRVYVLADATNGAIRPGDLLTTSAVPGRAMRVGDHSRAQGAILGKAMTGLSEGKGLVLVLVSLQ